MHNEAERILSWCNEQRAAVLGLEPVDSIQKGTPTWPSSCPIANTLAFGLAPDESLLVSPPHWWKARGLGRQELDVHPIPEFVRNFIADFDAGKRKEYRSPAWPARHSSTSPKSLEQL